MLKPAQPSRQQCVLIETSWNVKGRKIKLKARVRDGINRNIVECKDTSHLKKSHKGCVLIETSWNVKN